MEDVENELSGILKQTPPPPPNMPDGRMYAPLEDFILRMPDGALEAKTRGHVIRLAVDGGIIIQNKRSGVIEFQKRGSSTE